MSDLTPILESKPQNQFQYQISANLYNVGLLVGIAAYSFAIMCLLADWIPQRISPLVVGLMCTLCFVTHIIFFNTLLHSYYKFQIERVFIPIVSFGAFVILFWGIPKIFNLIEGRPAFPPVVRAGAESLFFYLSLLYFLFAFASYGKLMREQKSRSIIRHWRWLNFSLVLSALGIWHWSPFPKLTGGIFIGMGAVAGVPLLFRMRWLAVLNLREKWTTLFYLSIVNVLGIVFVRTLWSLEMPYILYHPLWHNFFLVLLISFVLGYGLMAWLILAFSMPIASFIEQQKNEIASFQSLNSIIDKNTDTIEIFKYLFEVCRQNTYAEAGWVVINASKENEAVALNNISSEQVGFINVKINFREISKSLTPEDFRYFPNLSAFGVYASDDAVFRSLLLLPVSTNEQSEPLGTICLVKSFSNGFSNYMIELCKSYVEQAQIAFENRRLMSEMLNTVRYKREWEIASRVQRQLMPKKFPENIFCDIAGIAEPAVEVGGDYYDYCAINEHQLAIIIGDVSGKGAAAAFHMAQMKGIFQALVPSVNTANEFLSKANAAISHCIERDCFISILYLLIDKQQRTITYSRAGHCPLLYYEAQTHIAQYLHGEGLALGIIRSPIYTNFVETRQQILYANDVVLLYTDGLLEGRQQNSEEQYGYERLKNCLEANADKTAHEISEAIYANFLQFTEGSNFKDDTSLLVIKVK